MKRWIADAWQAVTSPLKTMWSVFTHFYRSCCSDRWATLLNLLVVFGFLVMFRYAITSAGRPRGHVQAPQITQEQEQEQRERHARGLINLANQVMHGMYETEFRKAYPGLPQRDTNVTDRAAYYVVYTFSTAGPWMEGKGVYTLPHTIMCDEDMDLLKTTINAALVYWGRAQTNTTVSITTISRL